MMTLTLYGVSWKMSEILPIPKVVVIWTQNGLVAMVVFGLLKHVMAFPLFLLMALTNYK